MLKYVSLRLRMPTHVSTCLHSICLHSGEQYAAPDSPWRTAACSASHWDIRVPPKSPALRWRERNHGLSRIHTKYLCRTFTVRISPVKTSKVVKKIRFTTVPINKMSTFRAVGNNAIIG